MPMDKPVVIGYYGTRRGLQVAWVITAAIVVAGVGVAFLGIRWWYRPGTTHDYAGRLKLARQILADRDVAKKKKDDFVRMLGDVDLKTQDDRVWEWRVGFYILGDRTSYDEMLSATFDGEGRCVGVRTRLQD